MRKSEIEQIIGKCVWEAFLRYHEQKEGQEFAVVLKNPHFEKYFTEMKIYFEQSDKDGLKISGYVGCNDIDNL